MHVTSELKLINGYKTFISDHNGNSYMVFMKCFFMKKVDEKVDHFEFFVIC